ncbi:hypothetical protein N8911_01775, partial [bacterium]|nr:hypothetical protein [bacterium]
MRTTSTYTLIKSTILVFFTLFAASISYAQSPNKLVKEATKLNNAKQYADAIVKLDLALSLDASNAKGYAQRGLAHDKLKNTEAAAADYAVASSLDNKEEDYFFEAGRLHNDLLQHKEAVQFLARALKLDKNNYMAYHEKIEAHMALRDFYMALEESQNAIGKNKTAQNYFFRGLANDSLQNYKDAIDDYGKAIKKDKSLEEAYVGLGFTLVRTKDLDRAAEVCEELLVLNPENTGAYF